MNNYTAQIQPGSGGSITGIFISAKDTMEFEPMGKGISTGYSVLKIKTMEEGKYSSAVESIAKKLQYLCYLGKDEFKCNSSKTPEGNGNNWGDAYDYVYAAGMPNSLIKGGFPSLLSDESISDSSEGSLSMSNLNSSYDFVSVQNWHVNVA